MKVNNNLCQRFIIDLIKYFNMSRNLHNTML
nr:MAG TPA: hypothetical protein [Caudoviricetes sp.]